MVGKPAPKFAAAKTIDGKELSNETLKGSITVLDFFAGNCPHCNKQLPRVEKIRQEYEAKGVRFVARPCAERSSPTRKSRRKSRRPTLRATWSPIRTTRSARCSAPPGSPPWPLSARMGRSRR
ncbi:MAG: peroxiredoxin family protein [Phycisphaerae bacterium]